MPRPDCKPIPTVTVTVTKNGEKILIVRNIGELVLDYEEDTADEDGTCGRHLSSGVIGEKVGNMVKRAIINVFTTYTTQPEPSSIVLEGAINFPEKF